RTHLLSRQRDGILLRELFTRDGAGTLLTAHPYEEIRGARIDDVGGILELLAPLEARGTLVRRSRELLETEIERFTVVKIDGMIIACAALYCYPRERMAEMACVAVHPAYRGGGRGNALLEHMEARAREQQIDQLFVLTTEAAHWFRERGFLPSPIEELPMERRRLYNYRRNSKVFVKTL
ncbi:MAG: amino-acid N-acetyltransferase, partial [Candidatus Sedimenticola endophacoides]